MLIINDKETINFIKSKTIILRKTNETPKMEISKEDNSIILFYKTELTEVLNLLNTLTVLNYFQHDKNGDNISFKRLNIHTREQLCALNEYIVRILNTTNEREIKLCNIENQLNQFLNKIADEELKEYLEDRYKDTDIICIYYLDLLRDYLSETYLNNIKGTQTVNKGMISLENMELNTLQDITRVNPDNLKVLKYAKWDNLINQIIFLNTVFKNEEYKIWTILGFDYPMSYINYSESQNGVYPENTVLKIIRGINPTYNTYYIKTSIGKSDSSYTIGLKYYKGYNEYEILVNNFNYKNNYLSLIKLETVPWGRRNDLEENRLKVKIPTIYNKIAEWETNYCLDQKGIITYNFKPIIDLLSDEKETENFMARVIYEGLISEIIRKDFNDSSKQVLNKKSNLFLDKIKIMIEDNNSSILNNSLTANEFKSIADTLNNSIEHIHYMDYLTAMLFIINYRIHCYILEERVEKIRNFLENEMKEIKYTTTSNEIYNKKIATLWD